MNFETMSKQRKMILIAAAIGIICMFLPWVSASYYGQRFSANGMRGWGIVVFICFVGAGVLAYMSDQKQNLTRSNWMLTLVAGAVASLIMVIGFLSALDSISYIGFGYYGAMAAALGILFYAYSLRSANDTLQNGFDSLKGSFNNMNNSPTATTPNTTTTTTTTTPISHTPSNDPTRPTV